LTRSRLTWLLALLAAIAPASATGADLAEVFRSHGVPPVQPPQAATDFVLPRLDGGEASLSDYQGQWVVLTFWATWCGPCRMEMPSLERLHRERQAVGLAILGVSVDSEREAAQAFAEDLGLSFPNFWDRQGRVGADYKATAIPLSYVIDPTGQVVALSRGARDWTRLTAMLDAALEAVPPGSTSLASYAGSGAVRLPPALDPPTADITLSDSSPEVGRPFDMEIRLRWTGSLQEVVPQPPKVHLPEGMVQESVTASSDSRQGDNVVTYRVTLRASEPGAYALDPVELRYTPRLAASSTTSPAASQISGPTVEVRKRTFAGLPPRTLVWPLAGLALVAVAVMVIARYRRLGRPQVAPAREDRYQRLKERLDAARGLRLQGRGADYLLEMLALQAELVDSEQDDREWAGVADRARYGGQLPPVEELDRLQRHLERRLEELRPDPEQAVRSSLRLKEETS
jgi:peroxiredoxin